MINDTVQVFFLTLFLFFTFFNYFLLWFIISISYFTPAKKNLFTFERFFTQHSFIYKNKMKMWPYFALYSRRQTIKEVNDTHTESFLIFFFLNLKKQRAASDFIVHLLHLWLMIQYKFCFLLSFYFSHFSITFYFDLSFQSHLWSFTPAKKNLFTFWEILYPTCLFIRTKWKCDHISHYIADVRPLKR